MVFITLDDIQLPADLVYDNEFAWSPVKSKKDVTLGGTLVIQKDKQTGGRPIVLKSTDETAWLTRAQLDQLSARRDSVDQANMTLTLADGRAYRVQFDTSDPPCIEAIPLQPGKLADSSDYFVATLKFIQV